MKYDLSYGFDISPSMKMSREYSNLLSCDTIGSCIQILYDRSTHMWHDIGMFLFQFWIEWYTNRPYFYKNIVFISVFM